MKKSFFQHVTSLRHPILLGLFFCLLQAALPAAQFSLDPIVSVETKEAPRPLLEQGSQTKTIPSSKEVAAKSSDSFFYNIADPTDPRQSKEEKELIALADIAAGAAQGSEMSVANTALINFNNVSMVEYIRFVSRISNRNFIFDENDLQFNVTIISEEPATIENIMTALLQELQIHDLNLIEDNNNLIIHRNAKVNSISEVLSDNDPSSLGKKSDILTQVFRLNTLDADRAVIVLKPLASESTLISAVRDNNQIIVTDISANVAKIAQLIKSIDAPNSGLVIGQYVSRLTPIDTLIPLAQQIMLPIALDQPLSFVPQSTTNSIFIVSSPFLVERTISILEYLDQDQGATRILNLKDLRMGNAQITPRAQLKTLSGEWLKDAQGNWVFKPEGEGGTAPASTPPNGSWSRDYEGKWNFNPNEQGAPDAVSPKGRWVKDKDGNWVYELDTTEQFTPQPLTRGFQGQAQLAGGTQKQTKFYIYKLRYRKGDSVEPAIRQIADTLQQNEKGNEDLISTLRSVQWLTSPNSLVFSGPEEALAKAAVLVKEIDTPMRQVLIEMLILETTLEDSLEFGVSYATRFGGGNLTGAQTFYSGSTAIIGALATTGITGLGGVVGNAQTLVPNGVNVAGQTSGFNLGVIGQKITHCGTEFGSLGALVHALHDRTKDKVVSNPKLLVEDNAPAELFVGLNTPYRTQSISNDFGSVITSNFEYRDIGTRLRVTPYLGNGDIIAMDIEEEVSTIVAGLITNADTANTSPGPTTRLNRTTTRVHIPDGYFLIISGMMQDEVSRDRNQIPCLGGVPLVGAAFSDKRNHDQKRNLMIFIRPKIVDTEEEINDITKRNQDIYDYKNCFRNSDEYEVSEALDLFNIRPTLYPEDMYECECDCNCDKTSR